MTNKLAPKILIIDESITTSTTLLVLLSTLSKDITLCSTYECGLTTLQQADDTDSPFDIIFMAYPPRHHEQEDIAIQVLALALQNNTPHHTIILKGGQLPPEFYEQITGNDNVLAKPITKEKLQKVLSPLHLTLPKLNCWEYLNCGREPGGQHCKDRGICPAAVDQSGDGIHGGENAGRACWASTGTLCGGQVQGTFANKIKNCLLCDFYKLVQTEEADVFESIDSILNRMRHKKSQKSK